jgi:15-cis-phytoene synthase
VASCVARIDTASVTAHLSFRSFRRAAHSWREIALSPDEYCQQKAAGSGSSFYYSFLFLPPEKRRAITALYAFCREVDDIADEVTDRGVARSKLAWWRTELANLYAGHPAHPVTTALQPFVDRYELSHDRLTAIIDGMEMDLDHHRYVDFDALRVYCYRVAGVVGLCAASIFGFRNRDTLIYAEHLGIAFQLTNIIRDVGEDARRGRIYLPQDELRAHQVSESDLLAGKETPAFQALMAFQHARAESFYEKALASLPAEDRKAQRTGLIMAAIYRTLMHEIAREHFPVLRYRFSLTPIRKLWLAWKTWVLT